MLLFRKLFFAPETEAGAEEEIEDTIETEEGTDQSEEGSETETEEGAEESTEGEEGTDQSAAESPKKETRVQRLANEARREREDRIRAEAELKVLREQGTRPATNNTAETERVRAERLALMTPEEKRDFQRDEQMAVLAQGILQTQKQVADTADKSTYDAKAATNPIYAKHAAWVEETLKTERARGNNFTREALLAYKIGQDALVAKPKAATKQAKVAAATRVATATAKPTSARSDTGAGRTGKEETLEEMRARILAREQRGDIH